VIRVIPTTPPQPISGNPFGFETDYHIDEKKHFSSRSPAEKLEQNRLAVEVKVQLEQFDQFPCEVDVTVSVSNGRSVLDGEIRPYEQGSMDYASEIVNTVRNLANTYAQRYPRSSFTFTVTQTVKITKVYPRISLQ
jgi:osmotically-inducible protein OsmY